VSAGTASGAPAPAGVPLLGATLGFCSLALGFAEVRPNRIARGTLLYAWQALSPAELCFLLVPLAAVAWLAVSTAAGGEEGFGPSRLLPLACGAAGNVLVCLVFALSGKAARSAMPPGAPFARVSMGSGAWLMALAGYVLVLHALHGGLLNRGEKALFSVGGLAVLVGLALSGAFGGMSVLREFAARRDRFAGELISHLVLSGSAVGAAVVIGIPLGVLAFRVSAAEGPVFFIVNAVQTIPSLALFGILIAPLAFISRKYPFLRSLGIKGVGAAPALIALTLYALLPIARNTYASLKVIDPGIPEAGRGMGMGALRLLLAVEIPLALPIVLSGVRISLVQAIGNTAVAALIGAGGFGVFVFQGLGQAVPDLILLGAIPVIVLAVAADRAMQAIVRLLTPPGWRAGEGP
jgi:osmoprotectant transport system permease protein